MADLLPDTQSDRSPLVRGGGASDMMSNRAAKLQEWTQDPTARDEDAPGNQITRRVYWFLGVIMIACSTFWILGLTLTNFPASATAGVTVTGIPYNATLASWQPGLGAQSTVWNLLLFAGIVVTVNGIAYLLVTPDMVWNSIVYDEYSLHVSPFRAVFYILVDCPGYWLAAQVLGVIDIYLIVYAVLVMKVLNLGLRMLQDYNNKTWMRAANAPTPKGAFGVYGAQFFSWFALLAVLSFIAIYGIEDIIALYAAGATATAWFQITTLCLFIVTEFIIEILMTLRHHFMDSDSCNANLRKPHYIDIAYAFLAAGRNVYFLLCMFSIAYTGFGPAH